MIERFEPHLSGVEFAIKRSAHGLSITLPAFLIGDKKLFLAKLSQSLGLREEEIDIKTSMKMYQTQLADHSATHATNVIAIASGKGGVGKSTVAVQLAHALTRLGAKVGLIDADIYGPSIPRMMGKSVESHPHEPVECHGVVCHSIGWLIDKTEPTIWRGPIVSRVLMDLFQKTRWPELDFLLVDLPPGTGDIQLTMAQKMPISGAVIVSTPQQISIDDAVKAKNMFEKVGISNLGWVCNMAGFVCPCCQTETNVFSPSPSETGLALNCLGSIPLDPNICYAADGGLLHTLDERLQKRYVAVAQEMQKELIRKPMVEVKQCWPKVEMKTHEKEK